MAVGTIIVASFWSKITAPEKSDERYNELAEKVWTDKSQFIVFGFYKKNCVVIRDEDISIDGYFDVGDHQRKWLI